MNLHVWKQFCKHKHYGFSTTNKNIGRFRASAHSQRHSVSTALRSVQDDVPSLT